MAITAEALERELERLQEQTRKEAEEKAEESGKDTTSPVLAPAPVSRQELYSDLMKKEAELEEQLLEARGQAPSGIMSSLFGQDILPVAQPEKEAEIQEQLAELQKEKESRYAIMVGGQDEYEQIQDLRTQLQSATSPSQRTQIQSQIDTLQDTLEEKGVVIGVTKSGRRTPVQTALPTMTSDEEAFLGKTVSNTIRGLQITFGVPEEEAEPIIQDESALVNLGAEIAPVLLSAPTGSFAVAKTFQLLLKAAGPTSKYIAGMLGPALGEAAVATEETGTAYEDIAGFEDLTATEKKVALMSEALLVDQVFQGAVKAGGAVSGIPVVGAFIRAVPTLLFGGEKAAREATGSRMTELLARAAGAKTPEEKVRILSEMRERMSANFEAQTGVKFDDYLKAAETDALAVSDGADPDVIRRTGAVSKLLPEGSFIPLTADIADSKVMSKAGAGIAGREGAPEFSGLTERQDIAMRTEQERIAEPTIGVTPPSRKATDVIPPGQQRTPEQIREEAEAAGTDARRAINEVVEREKGQLTAAEEEAQQALDEAVESLRLRVTTSPAVSGTNVPTIQATERASDDAADVFMGSYKAADNQRKKVYEDYTKLAEEMEIPAADYQKFLETIGGEKEVGNVIQILIDQDPMYGQVLGQLQDQSRKLEGAIREAVYERTKDIPKPKVPKATNPEAWADYNLKVSQAETNVLAELANNPKAMQALKDGVGYQEIKLSNVEGLLQGINAELRAAKGADKVALERMASNLEQFVSQRIPEGSDLANLREGANQYFQEFQGFYKYVDPSVKSPLRYGENIEQTLETLSDAELGSVQDGFNRLLTDAVSGSDTSRVARQTVENIRTSLRDDPEKLAQFEDSLKSFYTNKLYGDNIGVYVDDIMSETDPQKVAAKAQNMARQISETLRSRNFAYLDQFAPGVRERLQDTADSLLKGGLNLRQQKKAVEQLRKDLKVQERAISARPEAGFSRAEVGSPFGLNSVKAAAKLIDDPDSGEIFASSWGIAGAIGKKGADGLTQAQRDLKTVLAQGISERLLSGGGKQISEESSQSLADMQKVIESPAVRAAFPEGDPTREMLDRLTAQLKGIQSRKAGRIPGESITGSLKQAEQFVDAFIRFEQGPLSREGRRSSMIARAFFNVVGGRARVGEVMVDAFSNPAVANQILKEQEEILRKGIIDPDTAFRRALGSYVLERLGISIMDELYEPMQAFVIAEQMQEMEETEN